MSCLPQTSLDPSVSPLYSDSSLESVKLKSINFLPGPPLPSTAQQSDRKASADPRSGPVLEEEEEAGAGGGSIRGCAAYSEARQHQHTSTVQNIHRRRTGVKQPAAWLIEQ